MTNKVKSSQLKYLLICIILTLFQELYKITCPAVYFFLKTPFHSRDYKHRLRGFYCKSLKSDQACIKYTFLTRLFKIVPSKNTFSKLFSQRIINLMALIYA